MVERASNHFGEFVDKKVQLVETSLASIAASEFTRFVNTLSSWTLGQFGISCFDYVRL